MDTYYPNIDDGYLIPIGVILAGIAGDPLWLDRRECPYDVETKACIIGMVAQIEAVRVAAAEVASGAGEYVALTDGELEQDLAKLHKELRDYRKGTGEDDMAYFRVAVTNMTKIVELRERMTNVKLVSDFKKRVFQVFENVLTPEQATRAIEMLAQA